jgi:superfamily II DNA or RNA helicase
MALRDLGLGPSYIRGWDDIAADFYLPCMRESVQYDRAVGYFSSTALMLAWDGLADFVKRGGYIRVVCSHVISDKDVQALREGYTQEALVEADLRNQILELLETDATRDPLRLLAVLVRGHILDLKIAVLERSAASGVRGIFHSKLGLFRDSSAGVVAFKGSMNETWQGLANDGNLESVDVFLSWGPDREAARVSREIEYFEALWNDQMAGVNVLSFPAAAKQELLRVAENHELPDLLNRVQQLRSEGRGTVVTQSILRPHQVEALESWLENGRRGILAYATGSGKTYVGLCAIRDSLLRGEVVLVVVPSVDLLRQWRCDLEEGLQDMKPHILVCGGGNASWQFEDTLRIWTRPALSSRRIILATLQTASSTAFLARLEQGSLLLLVVDEVHRAGSPDASRLLSAECGPRLGMSATPTRAGDDDGTTALLKFFDGVLPCSFTLKDGIREGILTPYFYYPHTIPLTEAEQEAWRAVSSKIALCAQALGRAVEDPGLSQRLKLLSIRRARIAKSAANKLSLAVSVFDKYYEEGQRWIVYCDSTQQAAAVAERLVGKGMPAQEYHTKMAGDRRMTLRRFDLHGGILVAIRCLDEGIDVPLATHGLVLASSRNPREFIQRRGRLLRKADGKIFAHIHDALVVPPLLDEGLGQFESLLLGELARARHFGLDAENPDCVATINIIAAEYGIDFESIEGLGYESEENDDRA